MAKFTEQFLQQVAQATDIVELVSKYVALKKAGKDFVGLCPFHDDHRPSMYVVPAKQLFKCFSCGAGGGVFQFMVLYEKLTFPQAVRALAEQANIPLPRQAEDRPGQEGPDRQALLKLAAFACSFYRSQLKGPSGSGALAYARGRGLSDESIERFGVGYAPAGWDALASCATRRGFSESQLVAAGLSIRRESGQGCYDRFRNRLIFPIMDPSGAVIAFGGRALDPSDQAKYINSPESALFDKSGNLYGLNWAREAIVSSGQAVVVEGYLDALMPLQAGVGNVVATLGTSLTERHARLLLRYAREVVLVFDSDAAGEAAAERALELFLAQRFNVRVATVPAGKDPCDFVLSHGAEAFKGLLAQAPDAMEHVWSRREAAWRAGGGNLADRLAAVEDFLRIVVSSAAYGAIDELRRGQLAQHIGHMLNVSAADLQQQMRRLARQVHRPAQAAQKRHGEGDYGWLAERHILEVLLNRPDLFESAAGRIDHNSFQNEDLRRIAECVWRLGKAGRLQVEELLALECLSEHGHLVAELATVGERRGNYEQTLAGAVEHMLYNLQRRQAGQGSAQGLSDSQLRQLGQKLRSPDLRRRPGIS